MQTLTKRKRRGAVVVEFAFTAPLAFLLLFGALELGHANMVFHVAEAAAFEGAREGIVPGASAADVESAVERILEISHVRGATVQVTPSNLSVLTTHIQVDVDVPYSQNTLIPPFFTQGLIVQRGCKLTREEGF
jgi:Flp pilus assembly protein TadG